MPAFDSDIPLRTASITHSTRSPSSKRPIPSFSIMSTHSRSLKHFSASLQSTVSTKPRAVVIISRTPSTHASRSEMSFASAVCAAKSRGKTFCGTTRFFKPVMSPSFVFCGSPAKSPLHQPSPKRPTNARRAPRSRYVFWTSGRTAKRRVRGARRAH